MPTNRIDSTNVSVITTTSTDFEVPVGVMDSATGIKVTRWQDDNYMERLGYYQDDKIPEITAIIDAKAAYVVGKGFKADSDTTFILNSIRGNGKETFNSIIFNGERIQDVGGNFYAHIIRDDDGELINLKTLPPEKMIHAVGPDGMLVFFEQKSVIKGQTPRRYELDEIF